MQEPISVGRLMEELLDYLEGDPVAIARAQGRQERIADLKARGRL